MNSKIGVSRYGRKRKNVNYKKLNEAKPVLSEYSDDEVTWKEFVAIYKKNELRLLPRNVESLVNSVSMKKLRSTRLEVAKTSAIMKKKRPGAVKMTIDKEVIVEENDVFDAIVPDNEDKTNEVIDPLLQIPVHHALEFVDPVLMTFEKSNHVIHPANFRPIMMNKKIIYKKPITDEERILEQMMNR